MTKMSSAFLLAALTGIPLFTLFGSPAVAQGFNHLHSEKMAPPYSNDWQGRLLRGNSAGTVDIYVKAGPKIPYVGVLRLSCPSGRHAWRSANNAGPAQYPPRPNVAEQVVVSARRIFCRTVAASPPSGPHSRRLWNDCRQRVDRIGALMDRTLCKWRNKLRNGNRPSIEQACLTNEITEGPCADLRRCRLNTRRWSTQAMNDCREYLPK